MLMRSGERERHLRGPSHRSLVKNKKPRRRGDSRRNEREDFAERDDKNWMKHTLTWADDAKRAVRSDYRPVHTYTMTNEISYIPPKARTY